MGFSIFESIYGSSDKKRLLLMCPFVLYLTLSLCLECEDHENGGLTLPPLLFPLPGLVLGRCHRKCVLSFHACESGFTVPYPVQCLPIGPGVSLHLLVLPFSCAKFKLPRYSFCLLWVASFYRPYQNQERWKDGILAF